MVTNFLQEQFLNKYIITVFLIHFTPKIHIIYSCKFHLIFVFFIALLFICKVQTDNANKQCATTSDKKVWKSFNEWFQEEKNRSKVKD